VDELSFRCGQVSVRREAANVLPVIVGIRDSAVGGKGVRENWGSGVS
jgi:hypothetical protein